MDVFYYWKDIKPDMEAGRVGLFRSSRDKLAELVDGYPDFIWVFKTPVGLKGRVQLMARLRWTDTAVMPLEKASGQSYIFYDPRDVESVRFVDSDRDEAIDAATAWVKRYFPASIRSNFQGENGQLALRGAVLAELNRLGQSLRSEPFVAAAEA